MSGREKVQDPCQGMSRGILSKILCPHLMRRSNCRSSVLQVDTCSATLQKITSFLRKLLLYFR